MPSTSCPWSKTTSSALTLANVQEWQSLDFHGFRGRAIFLLVAGLLVLRARSRRVWSWFDVACLGLSLLAALSYSRFLLFAGIVICPLPPTPSVSSKLIFRLLVSRLMRGGRSRFGMGIFRRCRFGGLGGRWRRVER